MQNVQNKYENIYNTLQTTPNKTTTKCNITSKQLRKRGGRHERLLARDTSASASLGKRLLDNITPWTDKEKQPTDCSTWPARGSYECYGEQKKSKKTTNIKMNDRIKKCIFPIWCFLMFGLWALELIIFDMTIGFLVNNIYFDQWKRLASQNLVPKKENGCKDRLSNVVFPEFSALDVGILKFSFQIRNLCET